jgi:8-oxo-dGTP pyrophosphatase MutT (NUDIX family)
MAAVREAEEEIGVEVALESLVGRYLLHGGAGPTSSRRSIKRTSSPANLMRRTRTRWCGSSGSIPLIRPLPY